MGPSRKLLKFIDLCLYCLDVVCDYCKISLYTVVVHVAWEVVKW